MLLHRSPNEPGAGHRPRATSVSMGVDIAIVAMADFGTGHATPETVACRSAVKPTAPPRQPKSYGTIRRSGSRAVSSSASLAPRSLPRRVVGAHPEHAMAAAEAERRAEAPADILAQQLGRARRQPNQAQ